jgi:hypothetical protein
MVEAIPVEKEEARVAFEQEVRAGRSAGLVEDVKGSAFVISYIYIHLFIYMKWLNNKSLNDWKNEPLKQ